MCNLIDVALVKLDVLGTELSDIHGCLAEWNADINSDCSYTGERQVEEINDYLDARGDFDKRCWKYNILRSIVGRVGLEDRYLKIANLYQEPTNLDELKF